MGRRGGSDGGPPCGSPHRYGLKGACREVLQCFLRGDPRRSRRLHRAVLAALVVLLIAVAGCGESNGVAAGATVTAYVAGPLCAEAKRELARHGGEAGDVRVRVVCLPSSERGGQLKLATIGANARRATEDSSSIAYIGEPSRAASRFAQTILEEAAIAQLQTSSGATAMSQLLQAVEQASGRSGSLRASVLDQLS